MGQSTLLSWCQSLGVAVSHGVRKCWRFETQWKTARFPNTFQNRGSTRSIAQCSSSKHCSDYWHCSVNGILCPPSSSSSEFRDWRLVSHKLSDHQKRSKVQIAVPLQAELDRAQRRNWTKFYTGDKSSVSWKNFAKECWLSLDEELPEHVRQTTGTEKSMLTVFQSEWLRYYESSATMG
jgi:hypothetical protein